MSNMTIFLEERHTASLDQGSFNAHTEGILSFSLLDIAGRKV